MVALHSFKLPRDRTVGGGAGVGANSDAQTLAQKPGRGMISERSDGAGLHVRFGTHVERRAALTQFLKQLGRFLHAHAMAKALGMQEVKGFANAGRAGSFSGMNRAVQAGLLGELKSGAVVGGAEAKFIAGQIEGADLVHIIGGQAGDLQAQFDWMMAQAADDEAEADAKLLV